MQSERHSRQLTETLRTIQCISVIRHRPSRAWEDFRANRYIILELHPSCSSITTNDCTKYEEETGRTMCHSHYSVFHWRKTFCGKICANYTHTTCAWNVSKFCTSDCYLWVRRDQQNGTHKLETWFQSLYYFLLLFFKASRYNFVVSHASYLGSDPIKVLRV